jgi:nucleotide-binding universal stress UspA family protein
VLASATAVAMVTHAPCPVAVVRGRELDPVDGSLPVVVGVDSSPATDPALAFAFEAAAGRRVPLVAVHTLAGHAHERRTGRPAVQSAASSRSSDPAAMVSSSE